MKKQGFKTLDSLPEVLTAKLIAGYLQISRRRVYELLQLHPEHGGIPNFKIGISKRVDKSDFKEWLKQKKEENKK
jgi:excisionase family DNA binding protein